MNADVVYALSSEWIHQPVWMGITGAIVLVAILIKSTTLWMAGYKGWVLSLLAACVAQLFSIGFITGIFYQKIYVAHDVLTLAAILAGGMLVIENVIVLIMRGMGDGWGGIIGVNLGQLVVYSLLIATYVLTHYTI